MKKFICMILIFSMILPFGLVSVSAEDTEYSKDDFKTWTQGDPRWGDYVYGSTNTIRYSGCMITALAVLIAYSDPSKRDWNTFNPKILARDNLVISGNILGDWRVYNLEGGDNFLFVECTDTYNQEDAARVVERNMNEGNYTMVFAYKDGVYSHFAPVVGWNAEESEPILWDVGSGLYGNDVCEPGCCWNTYFRNAAGGMYRVLSYKSLISSSLDTIYNEENEEFDPSTSENADKLLSYGKSVAQEWELAGMPTMSSMVSSQINIKTGDVLTWSSHLKDNSVSIKTSIEYREKTVWDIVRVFLTFVGMLIMLYAVMLYIGAVFDRVNSFIDINAVSLLTLGRLKLSEDTEITREMKKKGYLSPTSLFKRIVIIFVIGILFSSGVVSSLMYRVILLLP